MIGNLIVSKLARGLVLAGSRLHLSLRWVRWCNPKWTSLCHVILTDTCLGRAYHHILADVSWPCSLTLDSLKWPVPSEWREQPKNLKFVPYIPSPAPPHRVLATASHLPTGLRICVRHVTSPTPTTGGRRGCLLRDGKPSGRAAEQRAE